ASQILPPRLGQPVIVENRGGAGGFGARAVAGAPGDGYTLMVGNTSTLAVIPAVSANPGYDPINDFAPIAKVTEGFQIVVVHPSSPWKAILAEAGVPDAEANTFFGLVAPARTPASIIRRINSAMNEGLQTPEVQKVITNAGSEAKPGTSEDFAAYIAVQHRKWKEVGKAAGVIIN